MDWCSILFGLVLGVIGCFIFMSDLSADEDEDEEKIETETETKQ